MTDQEIQRIILKMIIDNTPYTASHILDGEEDEEAEEEGKMPPLEGVHVHVESRRPKIVTVRDGDIEVWFNDEDADIDPFMPALATLNLPSPHFLTQLVEALEA